MNIFVLDKDPIVAAKMQCDKHVVKMVLETAQMLCTAHPKDTAPYKPAYINHPCTVWARQSVDNYRWLSIHGLALALEYRNRYKKIHKSEKVIMWCHDHIPQIPTIGITSRPKCMPDKYKVPSVVQSYRNYYNGDKAGFAQWKFSESPEWFMGEFVK